jgi:hypothetical protein
MLICNAPTSRNWGLPGLDCQTRSGCLHGAGSFFLKTRLQDTLEQVVQATALRWTVETLFADFKELMGSDHYQLHTAEAIRCFGALGLCLYQFLDGLRHRLQRLRNQHVTLGVTMNWLRER